MFVAREEELNILKNQLKLKSSSLVAVYGRRRIGKTETIRYFIKENNLTSIEITGVYGATKKTQIDAIVRKISRASRNKIKPQEKIKEWSEAFYLLEDYCDSINDKKKIIFLDEFPWLDTQKSGFLSAFSFFWNDFCTRRDDIILIICGSAASYMINKVIKNNKTLHNRVTQKLNMQQFDLTATKKLLVAKGCRYSVKSILDTYIVLGGVAKYINDLDCSKTQVENIDYSCFNKNGLLVTEYQELYESLFKNSHWHYKVMNLLSNRWSGYIQKDIAKLINSSASVTKDVLEELELSGFISSVTKFNQIKRDKIYRATDCFSYFYNKWMKDGKLSSWKNIATSQQYKVWSGFAFENICHMHIEDIKKSLGTNGVDSQTHYWQYTPKNKDEKGAQIDMLIEYTNKSRQIDIIECKYYNDKFVITKAYYEELKSKINIFNEKTNFRYDIRIIFVTMYGVEENEYYNEIVQKQVLFSNIINL